MESYATPAVKLISTDFDGTLFAEFENPPVPLALQSAIGRLQELGTKWVINTGRDLASLLETLGRSHLSIKPDYIVVVEREIYLHHESEYRECAAWNGACTLAHAELFNRVRKDIPQLRAWVNQRFAATLFEDIYSPFCLIAESAQDADAIHAFLEQYRQGIPELDLTRNDVYARFCHKDYNKGTALTEIGRQLNIGPEATFAVGDHFNDLPMLQRQHAHWLAAPRNAIDSVKAAVRAGNGYVSQHHCGHGVADGLEFSVKRAAMVNSIDGLLQRNSR